jgi:O-antigen ligase
MFDFARNVGLVFDPNAIRIEQTSIILRESGELRSTTTAPHPIVFSAVIALALLVATVWFVYADRRRTRVLLAVSGIILVLALPVANSRTAFVMLAFATLPLFILLVAELPKLVPMALVLVLALGGAFAISPETPRLLLDSVTRSENDQNTQIRLERFQRLPELLAPRPIVGAGYLTHDPAIQIFDNAYNLGLIEFGILGLILTIWWFLCCLVRSWTATRWARREEMVLPVAGVLTAVGLLAASSTFDAWTFDQYFPTCLVVLGVAVGTSDTILRRRDQHRVLVESLPTSETIH